MECVCLALGLWSELNRVQKGHRLRGGLFYFEAPGINVKVIFCLITDVVGHARVYSSETFRQAQSNRRDKCAYKVSSQADDRQATLKNPLKFSQRSFKRKVDGIHNQFLASILNVSA